MKLNITATIDDTEWLCNAISTIDRRGGGRHVAVCCPVHPPKFAFLKNCIEHFYRHNLNLSADFWIVFSNMQEAVQFTMMSRFFEKFLIMPNEIDTSTRDAINRKKLYAVSELSKMGYDYIIMLDADFTFVRTVDLEFICNRFWEEKIIISCYCSRYPKIVGQSFSHFKNHPKSNKIDLRLYSWLNQPCIYKCDTVRNFFNILGVNVLQDFNKFVWEDFDYLLYAYYLLLYENFKEYIMPDWIASFAPFSETKVLPENFSLDKVVGARLLICSKQMYFYIQSNKSDNEIILVTHLDR